ncbi:hypothetical protein IUJ34_01480 [Klebsiella pneumoniae subsp. pneumoniae]|uniref:Uncharacterized protein n=1 Tax=Klebsiella pneumoniae subsp. pneumoniae TaxID=72407 RepID=A0A7S9HEQ0_KLEPN|nr:hypothetical protein IUJ34_01480 [Klebsiella pneumoniae subsp. pneumoniae]
MAGAAGNVINACAAGYRLCREGTESAGAPARRALTVSQFSARLTDDQPPVKLVGTFHLPLVPDGLPVDGQMQGTFEFPQTAEWIDAELEWQHNRGQLLVTRGVR